MKNIIISLGIFLVSLQIAYAQDYRFGKVSKEELQQKEHPRETDADAAILYREMNTTFEYTADGGFEKTYEIFERVKIYSKAGFDNATKKISVYEGNNIEKLSDLKGYVYNLENGNVVDEKLKKSAIFETKRNEYYTDVAFTMPNVKEGSVIEYQYKIKSAYIDNIDPFVFQEEIPVDKVYMSFSAPEYFNYKMYQKGWLELPVKEDSKERKITYRQNTSPSLNYGANRSQGGNFQSRTSRSQLSQSRNATYQEKSYEIELEDVPALKEEAYSGDVSGYGSAVIFELSLVRYPGSAPEVYTTTWEDVSKNVYKNPSFGSVLTKTDYFASDLDALLVGAKNSDEKVQRIFHYVKNKMNWNDFKGIVVGDGVRNAYKNNTGNVAEINLMLTAMLKYAGINASPVLISSKNNGIPLFPTSKGFDYVVAGIEGTSTVHLLDASDKEGTIDVLPLRLLNWQGRILRDNGSSTWVKLYPDTPATESMLITAELSEDLNVTGTTRIRYTGHYARKAREEFLEVSVMDTQKKLEASLKGAELSEIKFKDLNSTDKPVSLEYGFELVDAAEVVGDKIYVSPLLFMTMTDNPFTTSDRTYPIDFGYAKKDRYIINITIPEGYQVETLPESSAFAFGNDIGSFAYRVNQKQNVLQMSVDFSIKEPVIPAADYQNLKKFFQLLIDKENEKVVLSKA